MLTCAAVLNNSSLIIQYALAFGRLGREDLRLTCLIAISNPSVLLAVVSERWVLELQPTQLGRIAPS
jgi:hypothetical protein